MRGKRVGLSYLKWVSFVEVLRDSLAYLLERTSRELVTEFVGMGIDASFVRVVVTGVMVDVLGPKDSRFRTESVKLLPILFCFLS